MGESKVGLSVNKWNNEVNSRVWVLIYIANGYQNFLFGLSAVERKRERKTEKKQNSGTNCGRKSSVNPTIDKGTGEDRFEIL